MDVRLDFPRIIELIHPSGMARQTIIRSARPNRETQAFEELDSSLAVSHYTHPLERGDIINTNGTPFVREPEPIVENDRILYRSLRVTSRNATVQRYVLRIENQSQRIR